MFFLVFILTTTIAMSIFNYSLELENDNPDAYELGRTGSLTILVFLLLSIILNIVMKFFTVIYFPSVVAFAIVYGLSLAIINAKRKEDLQRQRNEFDQIFEIIDPIYKVDKNGIDYNNIPFDISRKGGIGKEKNHIIQIVLHLQDMKKATDGAIVQTVSNLNRFFPYRRWRGSSSFPDRTCTFIGDALPPEVANYPGAELRPWQYVPIGVGGKGEIGWNLGASNKEIGRSMYMYELENQPPYSGPVSLSRYDENSEQSIEDFFAGKQTADTVSTAKAPHCLCLGSTGGGKAIYVDQEIF